MIMYSNMASAKQRKQRKIIKKKRVSFNDDAMAVVEIDRIDNADEKTACFYTVSSQ